MLRAFVLTVLVGLAPVAMAQHKGEKRFVNATGEGNKLTLFIDEIKNPEKREFFLVVKAAGQIIGRVGVYPPDAPAHFIFVLDEEQEQD